MKHFDVSLVYYYFFFCFLFFFVWKERKKRPLFIVITKQIELVTQYNLVFINWVEYLNLPPERVSKTDVSSVSPCQIEWQRSSFGFLGYHATLPRALRDTPRLSNIDPSAYCYRSNFFRVKCFLRGNWWNSMWCHRSNFFSINTQFSTYFWEKGSKHATCYRPSFGSLSLCRYRSRLKMCFHKRRTLKMSHKIGTENIRK